MPRTPSRLLVDCRRLAETEYAAAEGRSDPPYNVNVEPRSNNAIAAGRSGAWGQDWKNALHHQSFDVARQGPKKATSKKLRAKDCPIENDFVSPEAFDELLLAWFGQFSRALLPGRAFYIWGGYANLGNYAPALRASRWNSIRHIAM